MTDTTEPRSGTYCILAGRRPCALCRFDLTGGQAQHDATARWGGGDQ